MFKIKILLVLIFLFQIFVTSGLYSQSNFTFVKGNDLQVSINQNEAEVVHTALEIFSKDFQQVFQGKVIFNSVGNVLIGTIGGNSEAEKLIKLTDIQVLKTKREGFVLEVQNGKLIVLGSDKRGTAYGILEISRLMGVSPWEWWADSPIATKEKLVLKNGFRTLQSPSVKHRGIFINDEDWGLTPWSYKNYEPSDIKGAIGPKTHARIFELLLRLRANTFWPAMHDCSVAFYMTPGNKQMADKYGIYVGTSHCEPMMRSSNTEWKIAGTGDYNYLTNRDNILKFWEERTTELASSDNIYTLGIRGVHDGKMQGANTIQEQKEAITQILKDQREMIKRIVNPDIEKVSQVFIPYKEVLDVYNDGLEVPEDVTLMWTDDNYGYINHFPNNVERNRKGGNGVYYHVSYWGRPHDYLWLSTTHPAQMYYQMKMAYDKGARDMWVINVGDIKPAEYQLEMLMDMAWNIDGIPGNQAGLDKHLKNWLQREFGKKQADDLLQMMNEYYRLAYIRKPEFMGNTRTEESNPAYKIVSDLPWSEQEINQRIVDYQFIENQVKKISSSIPESKKSAWFQLIEYPVVATAQMNKKILYGQLARHGKADWSLSDKAYDQIVSLTKHYNELNGGKWKYMMDAAPRDLAVFKKIPHDTVSTPLQQTLNPLFLFNGIDYKNYQGIKPIVLGHGYERKAICIEKNTTVNYVFKSKKSQTVRIEIALAPNHPVEGKDIRFAVSLDNEPEQLIDFRTFGRSEEWKLNVLRNQAIRKINFVIKKAGKHTLSFKAVDEGVVLDQIKIFEKQ
ncbi:MAG TPA: glycosyl hydrolase 115 family protein [Paludibacter sp.]|nr:glycosyl hydrolase 115 family protein [Paludibacter sp.]